MSATPEMDKMSIEEAAHVFSELRKENAELKLRIKELEEENKALDDLCSSITW